MTLSRQGFKSFSVQHLHCCKHDFFYNTMGHTVYPKKYTHGFVVLCFVVVMQSFVMNSHEVVIHIHQGCFAGTGAIVRLPQCQWSKPDGYGKISQCITTTKHGKAKTVCIFLGIYCMSDTNDTSTVFHSTAAWAGCIISIVTLIYSLHSSHEVFLWVYNLSILDDMLYTFNRKRGQLHYRVGMDWSV